MILLGTSFTSARLRRTERMIRQGDEELYHLSLLTAGAAHVEGHERDGAGVLGAGDFHLVGSARPYASHFFGTTGAGPEGPGPAGAGQSARPRAEGVGIDLPASLLPVPVQRLQGMLGRRLVVQRGTGTLLAEFLLGLDRQAAMLQPAEATRLGSVVADLVSAWIAQELDAEHALDPETRQQTLVESIRSFIRHNLHDPELTPPAIAAAHHISVSHLHRLFTTHSQGETVAAFIRNRRMKLAYRELADPTLLTVPIHAIAARCGLPRPSEFGRAFKAAHGVSPREHRQRALAGLRPADR
ncbi:helix-turn-helix domain-containing protein [Kitasatospora sp. MMS16-BH015]|uniref:helix-turn-helix domain-containing protein n=1 Tax=Kitasatospora sp. MMS16-BH015 TaxID=2018025 RepID=UPI0020C43524|nr:helix-turn-helix domain-containing protein [Kitasatospora sp. MMS16-BH015]